MHTHEKEERELCARLAQAGQEARNHAIVNELEAMAYETGSIPDIRFVALKAHIEKCVRCQSQINSLKSRKDFHERYCEDGGHGD